MIGQPAGRWTTAALSLLVVAPMVFNAITLWPEVARPLPSLNDDAVHYLMIQRASEALAGGENPFDHWVPDVELGFPMFLYYQHLPHLAVVVLHRLLLQRVDLFMMFNAVRLVLLVAFPVVVYACMRRMEFSRLAAAVGAAAASLLSGDGRYGFEYGSYIWRGHGMYTQLWAMPLSFVTLACMYRLLRRGTGYLAAILACAMLALSHLVYAYMMAITVVVLLFVGISRAEVKARLARVAVVGALAAIISSYMWLPFLLGKAYFSASPYLQRWKYDSFGARDILTWLVNGDLLDAGRLPVLTVLLVLGIAAALFAPSPAARLALALFVVWLALFFGRVTWGRLVDVLPMHDGLLFHRFIGGVHLAAILLIGLGGDWLWRHAAFVPARWRAAAVVLVALLLLIPAFRERHEHYALNTQWMERSRRALDADGDARTVLTRLRELPPGRTYVGLRADWGGGLRFGDLHFYDLLTFNRLPAATPPYSSWSLNADMIWHFDDHNLAHYEVFGVSYLVAPRGWTPPEFLRPLLTTGRYVLYESPNRGGHGQLVELNALERPVSQAALFLRNRAWFLGRDPAERRFVRYDFPLAAVHGTVRAADGSDTRGESSDCPDGRVTDERVAPGQIDLRTACGGASTLVIKTTYHPNWRVTVDGREAPAFMVSPSFIGLTLPPGAHRVRAEYRSSVLKQALLILGAVTLVGVIVCRRRLQGLEAAWPGERRDGDGR